MKEKKVDSFITLSMRKNSKFYQVAVKSATQKNKYYRQSTSETELRKATVVAKQIAEDYIAINKRLAEGTIKDYRNRIGNCMPVLLKSPILKRAGALRSADTWNSKVN